MAPFSSNITVLTPTYMLTGTTSLGFALVGIRCFSFTNGGESALRLVPHRFAKDVEPATTLTRNTVFSLNLRAVSTKVRLPL